MATKKSNKSRFVLDDPKAIEVISKPKKASKKLGAKK